MEGDEAGIFCGAPDWKSLFLLKIKIKQNPSCQIKEYNAIFKHIHQNIMAYHISKKICIDQRFEKYYCIILGGILAKPDLFARSGLFQM